MVMGEDSRSSGCGFESQHQMLDRHFSQYIAVKFCLKRPEINKKEVADGPILRIKKGYKNRYYENKTIQR